MEAWNSEWSATRQKDPTIFSSNVYKLDNEALGRKNKSGIQTSTLQATRTTWYWKKAITWEKKRKDVTKGNPNKPGRLWDKELINQQ